MIAVLLDKFHLTPDQIARLTDSQITKLYFHKRQKDGTIRPADGGVPLYRPVSDEEQTLETVLRDLAFLAAATGMSSADLEKVQEQAKAKYADG